MSHKRKVPCSVNPGMFAGLESHVVSQAEELRKFTQGFAYRPARPGDARIFKNTEGWLADDKVSHTSLAVCVADGLRFATEGMPALSNRQARSLAAWLTAAVKRIEAKKGRLQ